MQSITESFIVMNDNSIIHRFIVPLGYTFSWFFGICLGVDFFDLFGHKEMAADGNPMFLWFYSVLAVYFAFLLECIFIFIDCGAIYSAERFSGKIFYLIAGILFHFFTTMWLVGLLISKIDPTWVYVLTFWVVAFKLGISIMASNIKFWLADVTLRTLISNRVQ